MRELHPAAVAPSARAEVALALRHGIDGLVAGGDTALERVRGGVPAHLEVAPAVSAATLEENLNAGDLGGAGDLVERETVVVLDLLAMEAP